MDELIASTKDLEVLAAAGDVAGATTVYSHITIKIAENSGNGVVRELLLNLLARMEAASSALLPNERQISLVAFEVLKMADAIARRDTDGAVRLASQLMQAYPFHGQSSCLSVVRDNSLSPSFRA